MKLLLAIVTLLSLAIASPIEGSLPSLFLQDEERFWEYISPVGMDKLHLVAYF